MYATFAGIEIPRIYDVEVSRRHLGERARTVGGKLRADTVAVKRVWTIQTRPMSLAQASLLLSHLQGTLYAAGAFWIKGLGSPVTARIDPDSLSEQVVAFGENGVWHNDGRQLTLVVEEV